MDPNPDGCLEFGRCHTSVSKRQEFILRFPRFAGLDRGRLHRGYTLHTALDLTDMCSLTISSTLATSILARNYQSD